MLPEEGGVCTNMDGIHVCACADGWTGDGYSTARYTAAHAEEGFVAPGGVDPSTYTGCADVDECTVHTDIYTTPVWSVPTPSVATLVEMILEPANTSQPTTAPAWGLSVIMRWLNVGSWIGELGDN